MADNHETESISAPRQLPARWRIVISAALVFHLVAIVVFPFFFQTLQSPAGPSSLAAWLDRTFSWYLDAAYLGHGYAFFAPDPGASHLVKYRLEFDDRESLELTFPDLDRHWPRLLYHRHFMLAEQLHADYEPPEPPPDFPREAWQQRRRMYDLKWKSFEDHLLALHGAKRIEMIRVEHQLPRPVPQNGGVDLRQKESYVEMTKDESRKGPQGGFIP